MKRVAVAFIEHGQKADVVRRQYGQALIDLGELAEGRAVLDALAPVAAPAERAEALGLIGRIHKQKYVNQPDHADAAAELRAAIKTYLGVYETGLDENGHKKFIWHGINAAALVARAVRDGIEVEGAPPAAELARGVLERVRDLDNDQGCGYWDLATGLEASIALGDDKQALYWAKRYIKAEQADAFEYASTYRQLREVWRLDQLRPDLAALAFPMLHGTQLRREGGVVEMDPDLVRVVARAPEGRQLEALLSDRQSIHAIDWLRKGLACGASVARIEHENGRPIGTGFVIRGSALREDWGDELVLVTNAHVLGEEAPSGGVARIRAVARFTDAKGAPAIRLSAMKVREHDERLDFAIATLAAEKKSKALSPLKVGSTDALRCKPPKPSRIYVIGHPQGLMISISLEDNFLLHVSSDHPELRYRSPTEAGNSGSPLFDEHWEVVGLHHSYVPAIPANCGARIEAIRERVARDPNHG
jgi:hypothetical protein